MLFAILTICGGLIAASSFIVAKKPNAAEVFAKIAPYQGLLGIGMLVLGVLWLLRVLPNIGGLLSAAPLTAGLVIMAIGLDLLIGFLLGFGILNRTLLSKSATAQLKGERLSIKLSAVQVPLGLAATVVGALTLVM